MPAQTETLVCIAGSGFRLLPLLSNPRIKTVYLVDQSNVQLEHAKKILALLEFCDYAQVIQELNPTSPKSLLYMGQHEQRYFLRARLLRLFFIGQFKPTIDLTQTSRWPLFAALYSRLLKALKKDSASPQNYVNYLTISVKKLMSTTYQRNFFWQQLVHGHAQTLDAFTSLISEDTWTLAKSNLDRIKVHFIEQDLIDFLNSKDDEIDFISASNIINYLSDSRKSLLEKAIEKSLSVKGQILLRSYIDPIRLNSQRLVEYRGKNDILNAEMTGSYLMKIYEKI